MRPALAPAITARQEAGPDAPIQPQRRELQRNGCLARAAHGEIANADDRKPAAAGLRFAEALSNECAIGR